MCSKFLHFVPAKNLHEKYLCLTSFYLLGLYVNIYNIQSSNGNHNVKVLFENHNFAVSKIAYCISYLYVWSIACSYFSHGLTLYNFYRYLSMIFFIVYDLEKR